VVYHDGSKVLPMMSKRALSERLVEIIAQRLSSTS
jgi:hypothetical protein